MDNTVIVLRDAIYSRLAKTKAITTCLLAVSDNQLLEQQTFHDVIWVIDDYLEDSTAVTFSRAASACANHESLIYFFTVKKLY